MPKICEGPGTAQSSAEEHADNLERLVQAVAGGEVAALSSLYALTAERLFAQARRRLRCKEDAEEVITDVFIVVWQNAASYDAHRGSVMAWLSVMTKNRAIDRLRRRRADISMDDRQRNFFALLSAEKTLTPEQLVAIAQADHALHRALQTVDETRRALIHMAFFEGLTHQEISATVGLPLGTIKSHLRRSLAELRYSTSLLPGGV